MLEASHPPNIPTDGSSVLAPLDHLRAALVGALSTQDNAALSATFRDPLSPVATAYDRYCGDSEMPDRGRCTSAAYETTLAALYPGGIDSITEPMRGQVQSIMHAARGAEMEKLVEFRGMPLDEQLAYVAANPQFLSDNIIEHLASSAGIQRLADAERQNEYSTLLSKLVKVVPDVVAECLTQENIENQDTYNLTTIIDAGSADAVAACLTPENIWKFCWEVYHSLCNAGHAHTIAANLTPENFRRVFDMDGCFAVGDTLVQAGAIKRIPKVVGTWHDMSNGGQRNLGSRMILAW